MGGGWGGGEGGGVNYTLPTTHTHTHTPSLHWNLFLIKLLQAAILLPVTLFKKRLQQRCFPVNFTKFFTTLFLRNTSDGLLLKIFLRHSIINDQFCNFIAIKKYSRRKRAASKKRSYFGPSYCFTLRCHEYRSLLTMKQLTELIYQRADPSH